MNINTKFQILSNDMVRRLLNTREELGPAQKEAEVDRYAKKLLASGYSREQSKKILVNGIKSYEARRKHRMKEGRSLRSTAKKSRDARYKRKLTGSSSWFKNNRKNKPKYCKQGGSPKTKPGEQLEQHIDTKTILFVEYTKDGEFASNLREMMKRLAPALGVAE